METRLLELINGHKEIRNALNRCGGKKCEDMKTCLEEKIPNIRNEDAKSGMQEYLSLMKCEDDKEKENTERPESKLKIHKNINLSKKEIDDMKNLVQTKLKSWIGKDDTFVNTFVNSTEIDYELAINLFFKDLPVKIGGIPKEELFTLLVRVYILGFEDQRSHKGKKSE